MRRAKLQLYEGKILAEVGKGQPKFKKVPQEQIGTMTGKQIISEIEGLFGIKVEMGSADAKKWLDIECDNYAANKKTKEDLASGAIVDNHNGRMKAVFDEEVAHSAEMKKKYEERYARQIAGEKEFFCGRFELDSGKFLETLQKFKMIVDFSERMEKTPGPSIICELDQGTMHVRTNGAISNAGMAAAKELIRQGAYDAGVVVNTHETPVSYIGVPLGYSSMYVTLRFLEASEIDASADLAGELAGKMEIGIDFGALDLCPTKKPNLSRVQGGQLYFLLTEARNHFLIDRIVPHAKGDNLVLSAYCSEHEDYLEAYGKDFAWRIAVLKEKARFTNCTVREADKKDGHFLDIIVPCKSSTVK